MLAVVVVLAVVAYVVVQVLRPAPTPVVTSALPASIAIPGAAPAFVWPASGQAAIGEEGAGTFATFGSIRPAPVASLAKMMTALLILKDHPLVGSTPGPTLTMQPVDVAGYQSDLSQGDSTVPIAVGEQLTERQALEALLVGSDDNMANVLARWDTGSVAGFVAKMNAEAQALGMTHSHYADTSGLDPGSAGTAPDQLLLAGVAMGNPTIASIVAEQSVQLPVAGNVPNYDTVVGTDGIIGVKTGNTPQGGGCFAVAATATVSGVSVTVLGVVMGITGPSMLSSALAAGKTLVDSARAGLTSATVLHAGQTGAQLSAPWAAAVPGRATSSATFVGWPGMRVSTSFKPSTPRAGVPAGTRIGTGTLSLGSQSHVLGFDTANAFPSAPVTWKLRNL